jgi:hypothetical protein
MHYDSLRARMNTIKANLRSGGLGPIVSNIALW